MSDNTRKYVIEAGQRLSESILWKLQRQFYDQWGVRAWSTGAVPSYVTNNPFIANAYASTFIGFLRDCVGHHDPHHDAPVGLPDPRQPIYVIELGAGSGRLGFLWLKRLLTLRGSPPLARVKFCYVLTDVVESNLSFWNDHPLLQPFFDEGVLDLARFDVEQEEALALFRSGAELSSQAVTNPVVVLANYVFDSLPQDSFQVKDGMLQEGRFTLISEQEREPGLFEAEFLERLRIVTSYSPVSDDYYDDPGLNAILRTYRQRLAGTSFLLPIGAIRSIRNLLALSSGNLLLLAADKGYTDESQLRDRDPSLDVQGSLSMQGMAVNLHAIQRYFQGLGGEALHTSGWNTTLVVSAFLARDPPLDHPETRAAFLEDVARLSPYHYYLLASGIRKERDAPSLERILAVLRLSHWDPQLILWFAPAMREQVKLAPRQIKREVEQAMERVWDHYYSMGEKEDLAFEIATILQKMNRPGEALRYYQRSRLLSGEHQATAFNMALCHHELEQLEEAIRYMSLALELDATYRPAREWQAHLQAQLENKRAG